MSHLKGLLTKFFDTVFPYKHGIVAEIFTLLLLDEFVTKNARYIARFFCITGLSKYLEPSVSREEVQVRVLCRRFHSSPHQDLTVLPGHAPDLVRVFHRI